MSGKGIAMVKLEHIRRVYCACGHNALVDLGADLLRDQVIHRLRCSVCGRKAATHTIVPTSGPGSNCDPVRDLEEQRRKRGW